MERIIKVAFTDKINDSGIYMKGIDASYHYEGYMLYKNGELYSDLVKFNHIVTRKACNSRELNYRHSLRHSGM